MKKTTNTQATHTSPRRRRQRGPLPIRWTAPGEPGGVEFDVTAVSANRNGGTSGDSEGIVRFNLSFGCAGEGVDAYLDQDGDGWGIPDLRGPSRFCELPPNYSLKPGDCNDYDKRANPMGTEICNLYDDDCDGQINEGLENVMVYRDEDGDGYGGRFGEMKMGCGSGGFGFSSTRDDCDDTNKEIHPGVKEICNARDDDCNGRVDDGARAACGQGWCRRLAPDLRGRQPACPARRGSRPATPSTTTATASSTTARTSAPKGDVAPDGFCLTPQEAAEVAAAKPDGGAPADGGVPATARPGERSRRPRPRWLQQPLEAPAPSWAQSAAPRLRAGGSADPCRRRPNRLLVTWLDAREVLLRDQSVPASGSLDPNRQPLAVVAFEIGSRGRTWNGGCCCWGCGATRWSVAATSG